MQGIAYKAGQSFADEDALEKARGRWNLEGYEKAQQYETMLSEEEKARWDKFNQEIKNAPIVENPSKPGWGKVILSGAAFLTGLDLVYNAYSAFQLGAGGDVSVMSYPENSPSYTAVDGVYFVKNFDENTRTWTYFVSFTRLDGTVESGQSNGPLPEQLEPEFRQWVGSDKYNYVGVGPVGMDGFWSGWIIDGDGRGIDPGKPVQTNVQVDPSSMGIVNPSPITHLPFIPGTTVPDLSTLFPQVQNNPDTVIEIDVPLSPSPIPRPMDVEPLTQEEFDRIVNPGPIPDPEKEPGKDPSKDPENPPYPGPGKDPISELPTYPEETTSTETPSLFGKLWEWLKAILDVLFKILNAIIALPFILLELLWDFLFDIAKALFVPSDGFWDDNMNDLKKVIWSDEIDEMIEDFSAVGDGSGGMFKDIVVSLMGVDGLVVIDSDSINSILDNIHSWVRGVFYPLLILFNVNSMYKLIRGTSLVEATRGLANRSKGVE